MISMTGNPTQQRWTSHALVPSYASPFAAVSAVSGCAHRGVSKRAVGVDVRVWGTRAPFAGVRAAAITAALPGTSAWRPPTS